MIVYNYDADLEVSDTWLPASVVLCWVDMNNPHASTTLSYVYHSGSAACFALTISKTLLGIPM